MEQFVLGSDEEVLLYLEENPVTFLEVKHKFNFAVKTKSNECFWFNFELLEESRYGRPPENEIHDWFGFPGSRKYYELRYPPGETTTPRYKFFDDERYNGNTGKYLDTLKIIKIVLSSQKHHSITIKNPLLRCCYLEQYHILKKRNVFEGISKKDHVRLLKILQEHTFKCLLDDYRKRNTSSDSIYVWFYCNCVYLNIPFPKLKSHIISEPKYLEDILQEIEMMYELIGQEFERIFEFENSSISVVFPNEIICSLLPMHLRMSLNKQFREKEFSNYVYELLCDDKLTGYEISDFYSSCLRMSEDRVERYVPVFIGDYSNSQYTLFSTIYVGSVNSGILRVNNPIDDDDEFVEAPIFPEIKEVLINADNRLLKEINPKYSSQHYDIGYLGMYKLLRDKEKYACRIEENRTVFLRVLKKYVLEKLDRDFNEYIPSKGRPSFELSVGYHWVITNCMSFGIDVSGYPSIKDEINNDKVDVNEMNSHEDFSGEDFSGEDFSQEYIRTNIFGNRKEEIIQYQKSLFNILFKTIENSDLEMLLL